MTSQSAKKIYSNFHLLSCNFNPALDLSDEKMFKKSDIIVITVLSWKKKY